MDTTQVHNPIVNVGVDAINRSFEVSPTTVFGVLVGLLFIAVIYLAWNNQRLSNKLIELNVDTVAGLKDLTTIIQSFQKNIDYTREHILDNIQNLQTDNHGK